MEVVKLGARIWPHQCLLKWLQMNTCTPVKELVNPWLAFAGVGVLQGGVYGQCTTYVSKTLSLSKHLEEVSPRAMFRGAAFAAVRDTVSQGAPFMLSGLVQQNLVDPVYQALGGDKRDGEAGSLGHGLRRATAVFGTSVSATVASQLPHNAQIRMQADPSVGYRTVVQTLFREHGAKAFYMGSHARIALLLVVNALNEVVLKQAWERTDSEP